MTVRDINIHPPHIYYMYTLLGLLFIRIIFLPAPLSSVKFWYIPKRNIISALFLAHVRATEKERTHRNSRSNFYFPMDISGLEKIELKIIWWSGCCCCWLLVSFVDIFVMSLRVNISFFGKLALLEPKNKTTTTYTRLVNKLLHSASPISIARFFRVWFLFLTFSEFFILFSTGRMPLCLWVCALLFRLRSRIQFQIHIFLFSIRFVSKKKYAHTTKSPVKMLEMCRMHSTRFDFSLFFMVFLTFSLNGKIHSLCSVF